MSTEVIAAIISVIGAVIVPLVVENARSRTGNPLVELSRRVSEMSRFRRVGLYASITMGIGTFLPWWDYREWLKMDGWSLGWWATTAWNVHDGLALLDCKWIFLLSAVIGYSLIRGFLKLAGLCIAASLLIEGYSIYYILNTEIYDYDYRITRTGEFIDVAWGTYFTIVATLVAGGALYIHLAATDSRLPRPWTRPSE